MTHGERDPYTGHMTTGHEWNGIQELNTRVPRLVFVFLGAAILFAIGYWILMPAWPLATSHTKGMLGFDDRAALSTELQGAALDRRTWTAKVDSQPFAAVQADPQLMLAVRRTGHALFGDNCAACHGVDANGNRGFPDLRNPSSSLWGRDPEALAETIRVGINAPHSETRASSMPSFGRDGLLTAAEIDNAVAYVQSLSRPAAGPEAKVAAGKTVFADYCAACHGEDAKGDPKAGAPNLTDPFWIYGGDTEALVATLNEGRRGLMPAWESRLSALQRKILALYVADLMAIRR